MRKKILNFAAIAFVAALGLGAFVCNTNTARAAEEETAVFKMVEGAQVRMSEPSGIRFVTEVNAKYQEELAAQYPEDTYDYVWGTNLKFTDANESSYDWDAATVDWKDESHWYTALVGIPETDYLTAITAQSYVRIYDADDVLVYSDTVENAQTRSIAQTASLALNSGNYTNEEKLYAYTNAIPNAEVAIQQESVTLVVDGEVGLSATVTEGYGIAWRSTDTSVATVDENGKVTAAGSGVATITATLGTATDSCQVEVIAESDLITGLSKTNGQWTNQNGEVGQVLNENNVVDDKSDVYGIDPIKSNSSTMYMRLDKAVMGKLFADTTVNAITFDIILSTGTAKIQRGNNAETLTTTSTNIGTYTDGENSYYSYSVTVTRWHYQKYAQTADLILRYTGGGSSIFFFVDNIATVEDYTTALYENKLITTFSSTSGEDREEFTSTNDLGDGNANVYGVATITGKNSATMYMTISYAYLQELFANTKVTAIKFDIILSTQKHFKLGSAEFSACTGKPSFTAKEVKIGNKTYYAHTITLTREYFASLSKDVVLRYTYTKDASNNTIFAGNSSCMYVDNLALVK